MSSQNTGSAALVFVLAWIGAAVVPGYVLVATTMKECGYPRMAVVPVQVMGILTLALGVYLLLGKTRPRVIVVSAFFLPLLVPILAYVLGNFCRSSWGW